MKRIVVYRLGSIGDTVIALPCFKLIKASYPDHEILILTNLPVSGNTAPLLSVLGEDKQLVDGVIEYPVGTRSVRALLSLAMQIRSLKADALIYLVSDRHALLALRDWLFFKIFGSLHIIGFPWSNSLRKNLIDSKTSIVEHEAIRLLRCLKKIGSIDVNKSSTWDLNLSLSERETAHGFVKRFNKVPYFSLNMGGKDLIKDWGLSSWQALLIKLQDKYGDYGLLTVGGDADFENAQKLLDCWHGPTINICGKLNPRQSAAVIEKSVLFIGHDSGPLHLASAVGVPSIGLFGNHNLPEKWHPYSKVCHVIHNMNGVLAISVDEVKSIVDCVLNSSSQLQFTDAP